MFLIPYGFCFLSGMVVMLLIYEAITIRLENALIHDRQNEALEILERLAYEREDSRNS